MGGRVNRTAASAIIERGEGDVAPGETGGETEDEAFGRSEEHLRLPRRGEEKCPVAPGSLPSPRPPNPRPPRV